MAKAMLAVRAPGMYPDPTDILSIIATAVVSSLEEALICKKKKMILNSYINSYVDKW